MMNVPRKPIFGTFAINKIFWEEGGLLCLKEFI